MRLLVLASIPIALAGAWVAWRALRGRPVRRFALNAIVGVALLAYFAITAGLGIFWVANQELPVFDPHYLFGYLTLLLVGIHVWINAPLLMRFVRRRRQAVAAQGNFRPTLAWAGKLAGVLVLCGASYWIGFSRGSSHVTVEAGAAAEPPRSGGPAGMPEQYVTDGGERVPLSRWYHRRSAHSRTAAFGRAQLDWNTRPPPFESYRSEAIVALPAPAVIGRATGAVLDEVRGAPRLAHARVTLPELSALLHLTQGITSITGLPTDPFHRRAAASSGALYPAVTHVVVGDVDGLVAGLYHYEPKTHALHRLRAGDVRGELAGAVAHPAAVREAPFAVVLSAIYEKSSWKYEDRGYRYCLLDVGHVAANAIVAGRGLGWATRLVARFDDAKLGALLGVPPHHQGPMLVLPFGAPAAASLEPEPAFEPVDLGLANPRVPTPVTLIASRTALRLSGATRAPFATSHALPARKPGETIALPAALVDGDALTPVVERRRSERRFGDRALALDQLATVLARASGPSVPSVEDQHALRIHVIANRVDGLAPGAYEYRPAERALIRIRAGDLADTIHGIALSQEVSQRAAAVVAISAEPRALAWPDGSRGFRYAWLDAGIVGGRMYLQAVALRLGVSSIGAFFDDELVELLGLGDELPALLVALGTPP